MFDIGYLEPMIFEGKKFFANSLLPAMLLLVAGILLHRLTNYAAEQHIVNLARSARSSNPQVRARMKQRRATTQVTAYVIKIAIWTGIVFLVIAELGVEIRSFVPIATVLIASLGFGGRRLVQDYVTGIINTSEQQFGAGDKVKLYVGPSTEPFTGEVESLTLRGVRIRLSDGSIGTFGHGDIYGIVNQSPSDWSRVVMMIDVPNSISITKSTQIVKSAAMTVYRNEKLNSWFLEKPIVTGVSRQLLDQTTLRVQAKVWPGSQESIKSILLLGIQQSLQAEGVIGSMREVSDD